MLADREQPGMRKALFVREFGRTASHYSNSSFVPNWIREPRDFLPPNRTQDIQKASELCGESYQCRYDYGMSLNREMAFFTKIYYDHAVNIKATNNYRVISCGVLETPRFGRKLSFSFTPGAQVGFECDQGFVLTGDKRRECTSAGIWNPPIYGYTECLRKFPWAISMSALVLNFFELQLQERYSIHDEAGGSQLASLFSQSCQFCCALFALRIAIESVLEKLIPIGKYSCHDHEPVHVRTYVI